MMASNRNMPSRGFASMDDDKQRALDQSEHPAVAQRQHPVTAQKRDERPVTVHLRARRIFTTNASGVLRSHRVKSPSGKDD
jgi:hypothetical protein